MDKCTITITMVKFEDGDGEKYAEVTNEVHASGWKRKEVLAAFLGNIENIIHQIIEEPNKLNA